MQPFEPQQLPIDDIQWDSLIPLIGKANRSLAYYDGILYGLANPDILLSPLVYLSCFLGRAVTLNVSSTGQALRMQESRTY